MAPVGWIYAIISLGDAAVLLIWGIIDLRAGHRRDGLFLMALGFLGLTGYGLSHYKEASLRAQTASAILEQKRIDAENLKLAGTIEGERMRRVELEKNASGFQNCSSALRRSACRVKHGV